MKLINTFIQLVCNLFVYIEDLNPFNRNSHTLSIRRIFSIYSRYIKVIIITIMIAAIIPIPGSAERIEPPNKDKEEDFILNSEIVVTPINPNLTPTDLANFLVGSGITISNVTYTGANIASGTFSGGTNVIGFEDGILLTSGSVYNIPGPNSSNNASMNNGLPGDGDLTALAGYPTYDASILSFNFIPNSDYVYFQYVFASEEYNEYVNTPFNDVFAFYVNGQNCALINNSPVSINTVNNGNPVGTEPRSNWEFYINNDITSGAYFNTEMDGFTAILTCASSVNPFEVNHIKLAIADATDLIYDSAVFIKAGSITTEKRPIILLPGMMASANYTCFFEWPIIFGSLSCRADSDSIFWQFSPTAYNFYEPLIHRLNSSGYTKENYYLSVFHYDWRQPLGDNVSRLEKHIDKVKNKTGQEKVDLIGHSMGGLVARTYVQSSSYSVSRNDVANLVTVGSPHKGAANSYPVWQAAQPYKMDGWMKAVFLGLLTYYMRKQLNPIPVYTLRNAIPSTKDLLPALDYLYLEEGGPPKPESEMKHRNLFLSDLNNNVGDLFSRTNVATIGSYYTKSTTDKFYVKDRAWWNIITWDDGEPIWGLKHLFETTDGDETVTIQSALLDGAQNWTFNNVKHASMLADNNIINRIFVFLKISAAPEVIPFSPSRVLAMFLDGSAHATITDPSGKTLDVNVGFEVQKNSISGSGNTIPGGEYIYIDGVSYKLIFIPAPEVGAYKVDVVGNGIGKTTLGLLDTFNEENGISDNIMDLWETSTIWTEVGSVTTFEVLYTENEDEAYALLTAETPLINVPVMAGDLIVSGRALPGNIVEIRSATTDSVLGLGEVSPTGGFTIELTSFLKMNEKIYPWSNGKSGSIITALPYSIFLPVIQ